MIRINLGKGNLKNSAIESNSSKLIFSQFEWDGRGIALLVASIALAFLPYLFVEQGVVAYRASHGRKILEFKVNTENLRHDIARFKAIKLEMESYEQQKKVIADRLTIVQQLVSNRNSGVNVLDAIGQALVPRAWLDAIDVTFSPAPKLTLTGRSFANEDVSDVVERLSQSIHLMDVALDSVGSDSGGARSGVRNFQITAVPKGFLPSPSAPMAAPGTGTMKLDREAAHLGHPLGKKP